MNTSGVQRPDRVNAASWQARLRPEIRAFWIGLGAGSAVVVLCYSLTLIVLGPALLYALTRPENAVWVIGAGLVADAVIWFFRSGERLWFVGSVFCVSAWLTILAGWYLFITALGVAMGWE